MSNHPLVQRLMRGGGGGGDVHIFGIHKNFYTIFAHCRVTIFLNSVKRRRKN